jgi:hypothetical protein
MLANNYTIVTKEIQHIIMSYNQIETMIKKELDLKISANE